MTLVLSCFPATGKTHYFNNNKETCLDSDSSKFDKANFPQNYIDHIKENLNKGYEFILVSTHKEVRAALVEAGIEFCIVCPMKTDKLAYLERYIRRGSSIEFLRFMDKNWLSFIDEIFKFKKDNNIKFACVGSERYLSDCVEELLDKSSSFWISE